MKTMRHEKELKCELEAVLASVETKQISSND